MCIKLCFCIADFQIFYLNFSIFKSEIQPEQITFRETFKIISDFFIEPNALLNVDKTDNELVDEGWKKMNNSFSEYPPIVNDDF